MKYTSLIMAMIGIYLLIVSQVSGSDSKEILNQKTSIDQLIDIYSSQRRATGQIIVYTKEQKGQLLDDDNLRLRSEVIDLRVERDRLASRVRSLESELKEVVVVGVKSNCNAVACSSDQETEAEKVLIKAASAVSTHNIGIRILQNSECEEAHKYANEMITGAIEDLKLLGFDTTNVNEELELDTLMNQIEQKEAQKR